MAVANNLKSCVLKSELNDLDKKMTSVKLKVEDDTATLLQNMRNMKNDFSELSKKFTISID